LFSLLAKDQAGRISFDDWAALSFAFCSILDALGIAHNVSKVVNMVFDSSFHMNADALVHERYLAVLELVLVLVFFGFGFGIRIASFGFGFGIGIGFPFYFGFGFSFGFGFAIGIGIGFQFGNHIISL
jgi:hypothetical protein